MASKRRLKRQLEREKPFACGNKVKHDNETKAYAASRSLLKNTGADCHPYKCPYCRKWHIGH